MDERTISPAGDLYHAAPQDQDERPCACNDGWVTIGQIVINENGDEEEEFAMYLCQRCSAERR